MEEFTCKGSHPKWGLGLGQFCTSASTPLTPELLAESKRWIRQKYLFHFAHRNNRGLAPRLLIDLVFVIPTHKHIARHPLVTPSGSRHQGFLIFHIFYVSCIWMATQPFANNPAAAQKLSTSSEPGCRKDPNISFRVGSHHRFPRPEQHTGTTKRRKFCRYLQHKY